MLVYHSCFSVYSFAISVCFAIFYSVTYTVDLRVDPSFLFAVASFPRHFWLTFSLSLLSLWPYNVYYRLIPTSSSWWLVSSFCTSPCLSFQRYCDHLYSHSSPLCSSYALFSPYPSLLLGYLLCRLLLVTTPHRFTS